MHKDYLSREEIARLQEKRFRETVERIFKRSPYYQKN